MLRSSYLQKPSSHLTLPTSRLPLKPEVRRETCQDEDNMIKRHLTPRFLMDHLRRVSSFSAEQDAGYEGIGGGGVCLCPIYCQPCRLLISCTIQHQDASEWREERYLQRLSVIDLDASVEGGDRHIDRLSLGMKLRPLVGWVFCADLLGDGGEFETEGVEG